MTDAFFSRYLLELTTEEIYRQKCSALFEHVYESYPERNAGVYV
ncbi:hypothetical protein [Chlorobium sp. KB01]|nr:hypothetical protein [Chlorobium sp. KB01]